MQIEKQKKYSSIKWQSIMFILMPVLALLWQNEKAWSDTTATTDTSITQITNRQADAQKSENDQKLAELERRASLYREIIEIKRKQQNSLNNQLSMMDTQMQQVEAEIEANRRKIAELDEKIRNLQNQISDKEKTLETQKRILGQLMQSYYENSQRNILSVVFTDANLASFVGHKYEVSQASARIKEMVDSITSIKEKLISDRGEMDKKRTEVVDAHADLTDKNAVLEDTQTEKKSLLEQTKGEEERYQQMLARVEEQKLELLDIDQLYATSGISLDDFPKPDSKLFAPLSWYYSQKDSRWGNMTIGNSTSLMKSYGCAVSAVAMVFSSHGDNATPKTLAKKPIFSWDLISWPQTWPAANLNLSSAGIGHGNINWSTIDGEIKKGNSVIVYIKKTNGKGGHYVVIHHKDSTTGKYVVHDPYFGPNIFLDTSKALVGAMGAKSGTMVDQMIIYN